MPAMSEIAKALTFHAGFDDGPDAGHARGDKRLYTEEGEPGLGGLAIAPGEGRFGGALRFTPESTRVVVFKAERNVAYDASAFKGTVSLWMKLDPADIPGQYCDPLQVTDKKYSDSCVWLDFTKNDTPSDFRLGVFGENAAWDPTGKEGDSQEFYWRLLKVAEPPFARDRWTHVAVTWADRARLYLDGAYVGAGGRIHERFVWDVANARIRLGTGKYVGLMDDLAFFDRPLTADEVRELHGLERGVASLY
jgi:hypothetical protein